MSLTRLVNEVFMNKKFYNLSIEKQKRIKEAGYKSFSANDYKKASMQDIADEADISKSLLFHYFRNKKTLYEWLFSMALMELKSSDFDHIEEGSDFFDMIYEVTNYRLELLQTKKLAYAFVLKCYSELGHDHSMKLMKDVKDETDKRKEQILKSIDTSKFIDEKDVYLLYDLVLDVSTGLYNRLSNEDWKQGSINHKYYLDYINLLKKRFYKEAYL